MDMCKGVNGMKCRIYACKNNNDGYCCNSNNSQSHLNKYEQSTAIDHETMPIVRQLRAELARVTAERDAAVDDLKKLVPAWEWD